MIEKFKQHHPIVPNSSWVHESAVVIGNVSMGDEVSIWPCAVVRGDVNHISIGNYTNIQDGAVIHATHAGPFNESGYGTSIGDDVTIGHQAMLHGCSIGNRVLVGMGATVLDGAVIEDDVMIGARALVTMNTRLESGCLYLGTPAKAVRELSDTEKEFLRYSARHYATLKKGYQCDD